MTPIISPEQYRAAFTAYHEETKQFKAKTQKLSTAMLVLIFLSAFSLIFARFEHELSKILDIIGVLLFIAMIVVFIVNVVMLGKYNKKTILIRHDTFSENAVKAYLEKPFTEQTSGLLTGYAASEKDILCRYFITSLLVTNKLRMGDLSGAYSCIMNDTAVFTADRRFELKYHFDLADYYSSLGNSPECIAYFEQAYENFANVFRICYPSEIPFSACEQAMGMMIMSAYIHGEWQNCFDLVRVKLEVCNSSGVSNEAVRAETALEKFRQAECLYHLGEYRAALILCDEAGPVLSYIPYQCSRTNALAGKLHKLLDAPKGE